MCMFIINNIDNDNNYNNDNNDNDNDNDNMHRIQVTTGQCQARCAGAAGCAHFSYWPY